MGLLRLILLNLRLLFFYWSNLISCKVFLFSLMGDLFLDVIIDSEIGFC